jgi:anti-sigma B factor antagonist
VHRVSVQIEVVATVTATGEVDAFAAPDLTAAFDELAASTRVLVDLGGVSFLDSTALGLVVHAVREIGERGGEARVVLPASSARRIFEITTLDRVLPIVETRAQGVAELTALAEAD